MHQRYQMHEVGCLLRSPPFTYPSLRLLYPPYMRIYVVVAVAQSACLSPLLLPL